MEAFLWACWGAAGFRGPDSDRFRPANAGHRKHLHRPVQRESKAVFLYQVLLQHSDLIQYFHHVDSETSALRAGIRITPQPVKWSLSHRGFPRFPQADGSECTLPLGVYFDATQRDGVVLLLSLLPAVVPTAHYLIMCCRWRTRNSARPGTLLPVRALP